jgi:hypothetical protein
VQTLFQLSLVAKIEVLLHIIYNYYAQSLKQYVERTRIGLISGEKTIKNFMQCEDALDFNVVYCQTHLAKIKILGHAHV